MVVVNGSRPVNNPEQMCRPDGGPAHALGKPAPSQPTGTGSSPATGIIAGSAAGSFPHPKGSSCAHTFQRTANDRAPHKDHLNICSSLSKLNRARGAVMHSLSVASRVALNGASRPFLLKYALKTPSNNPLKFPPLEKACLFPLPMLHYQHISLNVRIPA